MSVHQLLLPLAGPSVSSSPSTPTNANSSEPPDSGARSPSASDTRAFHRRLQELSQGRILKLTLTRNRSTILSAKPIETKRRALRRGFPKQVHLRIHRCFVGAPEDVLQAAADFAAKRLSKQNRRAALAVLRAYFDEHAPRTATPSRSRTTELRGPKGDHHDLEPMFDTLNAQYFDNALDLTVTWGAPVKRRRRRRRTIQLGSFQDETQSIRMHPVLDRKDVPRYVVEAVLHHEMVHAVVPAERSATGSRRRIHTERFRQLEAKYEHLQKAERWLGRHLFRLMGKIERELARSG